MGQIVDLKNELAWEIVTEPMTTESGIKVDGYKNLRRSDNDKTLNCVKNSYNPMSNFQFMETINKLAEVTGFEVSGFSEFNGGGIVLGFLKNTKKVQMIGDFEMEDYMVLGNTFDFSSSIFVASSSEYIRCKNQFSRLKKGKGLSVPHTKNKDIKVEQLVKYFEVYMDEKKKMYDNFERFTKVDLTEDIKEQFISKVLLIEDEGLVFSDELSTRKVKQRDELLECITKEEGDLGETLWAAFNGVTYWTTHVKETKKGKIFGNVLGGMADINDRAYKAALELVEA